LEEYGPTPAVELNELSCALIHGVITVAYRMVVVIACANSCQPGIAKIRFMAVFATIIAPAQQSA